VRVLLDEQLPRQLVPHLVGHDVRTVQQESWAGFKNGALLTQAEAARFSVFLTGDHLEFQQNISKRRLGVVVLYADSNAGRRPEGVVTLRAALGLIPMAHSRAPYRHAHIHGATLTAGRLRPWGMLPFAHAPVKDASRRCAVPDRHP
jgi:hypothetical protein